MEGSESPVLAIDLGGTKILAVIISSSGQVIATDRRLSLAKEGSEAVIKRIFAAADSLLARNNVGLSQLHSISIAAAGIIDSNQGIITLSPNLPGWQDIRLRDIVKERYGVDTFLLNDASAGALGEHHFGAGKGVSNLIYLTVSTGIGGGIIINDKLYLGESGSAGEIGHMTIDVNGPPCSCGNTGCLEVLASGTAMAGEAIKRIRRGESSSITDIVGGEIENITAEKIAIAAQGGDNLALEVISEVATYLGVGLANLVNIFNPELIVTGGGVAKMGDLLFEPAKKVMRERAFHLPARVVRIVPAMLGDNVGVLGAAVFARQQKPD